MQKESPKPELEDKPEVPEQTKEELKKIENRKSLAVDTGRSKRYLKRLEQKEKQLKKEAGLPDAPDE